MSGGSSWGASGSWQEWGRGGGGQDDDWGGRGGGERQHTYAAGPPGPPPTPTVDYMQGWQKGWEAGFQAAMNVKANNCRDDDSVTEVVTTTRRSKKSKSKKHHWFEYTDANLDASPVFFWKQGTGEGQVAAYPEEIQVKLRDAYEKKKAGEEVDDIKYPMTDDWVYRLRIIGDDEAELWKPHLRYNDVNEFVGVQWSWFLNCDPPTDFGKDGSFRPIKARVHQ